MYFSAPKEAESSSNDRVFHRCGEGMHQHRQLQLTHGYHRYVSLCQGGHLLGTRIISVFLFCESQGQNVLEILNK